MVFSPSDLDKRPAIDFDNNCSDDKSGCLTNWKMSKPLIYFCSCVDVDLSSRVYVFKPVDECYGVVWVDFSSLKG